MDLKMASKRQKTQQQQPPTRRTSRSHTVDALRARIRKLEEWPLGPKRRDALRTTAARILPPDRHPFDLGLRREGNLMMFHPHSRNVREWMEENVNIADAVRFGNAVAVDLRYAGPILEGMQAEGFTIGDEP
jgi:hypothetical protein